MSRQYIARLAFSQRNHSAFVVLADHSVTFPITHTCFLRNDLRTLINADTVLDRATSLLSACITLAARFLAALMSVKASAISFVRVNVLVDDLVANLQAAFQLKSICGLFRAEVFLNQPLDFRPFIQ